MSSSHELAHIILQLHLKFEVPEFRNNISLKDKLMRMHRTIAA